MMIKVEGEVYPYTMWQLRSDHPGTAFPADMSGVDLSLFGAAAVVETEPPVAGQGHRVVESAPVLQGDQWVQTWTVEALPVPSVVSRKQARMALVLSEISLASIQSAIDSIEDSTQRALAQIAWDDAVEYRRDDSFLVLLAGMLGLTDEQLDGLFLLASGL